jgi:hypothetical protein
MNSLESSGDIGRQARDRYAELVDKKFRSSLSESEQAELLRLQAYLDEAEAGFYEPGERRLEAALTKLRTAPPLARD